MAQVKLNATSLSSIRRQIEKMENESEAAQKKVQSAINGLDFEVSSKHNIRSSLNKIKNSLDKQAQGAINYRTAFTNVTNSLIDTDNKFESESKGILDKIKDFVEDAVGAVKSFFVKNKLAKIAAVSGLFLVNPVMTSWAITVKFLSEFVKWVNNIGTITAYAHDDGDQESNNNNNNNNNNDTVTTPPEEPSTPSIPEGLKHYEGSKKDLTPNGYSDFNVVDGFDDSLVHSQFEYDTYYTNSSGQRKNGGCTSVSDSIVYALNNDTEFSNPENSWKNGQTYWTTTSIRSQENLGAQDRCNEVYNQIVNNGKAVVIRVTNHSMAAVGIKAGADPNNVTAADILVCDSGYTDTGRICTLQEYLDSHSGREIHGGSGYALRV